MTSCAQAAMKGFENGNLMQLNWYIANLKMQPHNVRAEQFLPIPKCNKRKEPKKQILFLNQQED